MKTIKTYTMLLGAAIAALAFSVSSFAAAEVLPPISDAEADAGAVVACMDKGRDSNAQVACILGMVAIKAIASRPAGGAAAGPTVVVQPAPVQRGILESFASSVSALLSPLKDTAIALAPAVAQVLVSRTNAHTQEVVAGFNRDTTLGAYSAFTGMGASIERAGTAGYQYVQAPGAVTTTTNTLSGTGVLGSGQYTGPVSTTNTTTRTCTGGQAGNGSGTATAPGAGGAGGSANC